MRVALFFIALMLITGLFTELVAAQDPCSALCNQPACKERDCAPSHSCRPVPVEGCSCTYEVCMPAGGPDSVRCIPGGYEGADDPETCSDGCDNDKSGKADFDDPLCQSDYACQGTYTNALRTNGAADDGSDGCCGDDVGDIGYVDTSGRYLCANENRTRTYASALRWWDASAQDQGAPYKIHLIGDIHYVSNGERWYVAEARPVNTLEPCQLHAWEFDPLFPDDTRIPDGCIYLFDLDADGRIDSSDQAELSRALGCYEGEACYNPEADYDRDGHVSQEDNELWVFVAQERGWSGQSTPSPLRVPINAQGVEEYATLPFASGGEGGSALLCPGSVGDTYRPGHRAEDCGPGDETYQTVCGVPICDAAYLESINAYRNEPTDERGCLLECLDDTSTGAVGDTLPKEACRDGNLEACLIGGPQGDPQATCAEQGGSTCPLNGICSGGAIIESANTEPCCLGGSCIVADTTKSCDAQGGSICRQGELCAGDLFAAQDTQSCCSGQCFADTSWAPLEASPNNAFLSYRFRAENSWAECCGAGVCENPSLVPYPNAALSNRERYVFTLGGTINALRTFDAPDPATGRLIDNIRSTRDVDADQAITITLVHPTHAFWDGFGALEFDISYLFAIDDATRLLLIGDQGAILADEPIEGLLTNGADAKRWHHAILALPSAARSNPVREVRILNGGATNSFGIDNLNLISDGASTSSANRWCAGGFAQWIDEMDPPAHVDPRTDPINEWGAYRMVCEAQLAYGWSGTRCCGDDTRDGASETYADIDAGCFDGSIVDDRRRVSDAINDETYDDLLFFDGAYHNCIDEGEYDDLQSSRDGVRTDGPLPIEAHEAFETLAGFYCTAGGRWLDLQGADRTRLVAAKLLELVDDGDDYTLFCDESANVAHNLLTAARAATGSLCVLEHDGRVVAGTDVREMDTFITDVNKYHPFSDDHVHTTYCEGASSGDDFFTACENTHEYFYAYYNPTFSILLFSMEEVDELDPGLIGGLWDAIAGFFSGLFGAANEHAGAALDGIDTSFNRIYLARQDGRAVRAHAETIDGKERLLVEYQNFTNALDSVFGVIPARNSTYLLGQEPKQVFIIDEPRDEELWRSMTSSLRIHDVGGSPVRGVCGDGRINLGEECEQALPLPDVCPDGYLFGEPACDANCQIIGCSCYDGDGDGYGSTDDCPPDRREPSGCDNDPTLQAPLVEVCNGLDDDCDGEVDEGSVCADCELRASCAADEVEVLRLSAESNAHAALAGHEEYPLALCCAGSFAASCDGGKPFVRLWAESNAHIAGPPTPGYDVLACIKTLDGGVLQTYYRPGECGQYERCLLRASDESNAHAQGCDAGTYPYSMCMRIYRPDACTDADGDGVTNCGGDCDDTNPQLSPDLVERCDGIDNDCDGVVDEGFDLDGDGFVADTPACSGMAPYDCDDSSVQRAPGKAEACDGIDNDCDGGVDEGCSATCQDADGDGYQSISCGGNDCDDRSAFINPGQAELCNGRDDDCDGIVDEGCGYGGGVGGCFAIGTQVLTPHGGVPIEQLREGDALIGYDLGSGQVHEVAVELARELSREASYILNDHLRVTSEHPFAIIEEGAVVWREVGELEEGMRLFGRDAEVLIEQIDTAEGELVVYNPAVSWPHTYYVNLADEWVLVHNKENQNPQRYHD